MTELGWPISGAADRRSYAHESLPVALRRDGCDSINVLSDAEKRLRMYIASICTLVVNSFPRIALGIRFRIASMARFS